LRSGSANCCLQLAVEELEDEEKGRRTGGTSEKSRDPHLAGRWGTILEMKTHQNTK